ncbi:MAG: hypothetical protein JWM12_1549 [Ilumatobacteraceae bacterium]|nr:hypothetical protein [Ilumatobacteraceae bacterium]
MPAELLGDMHSDDARRRSRGSPARCRAGTLLAAACAALLITGCVNNPVGSARNGGIYAAKAAASADAALSAVSTVQLVARAAGDHKVFGTFASVSVDQQEDALTEITTTFRSIQPPDAESRALRDELGELLDRALEHLAAVRVEIRRGRLATAAEVAAPLAGDARQLDDFAQAHQ